MSGFCRAMLCISTVFKEPTSKGRGGRGKGKGRGRKGVRRAPISCWHRAPEVLIRHWPLKVLQFDKSRRLPISLLMYGVR